MRVAIVAGPYVPIPPKQYGGIEQVIYYLIKGLKEAGHTPILIGPGDSTVDCEIIPNVERAIYFPKTHKGLAAHDKLVRAANRKTKKIIKSLLPDIDIIHAHNFDLSPFADFPNVTTIHNRIELQSNVPTEDLGYYMKRNDLYYVSISQNQQAAAPELNYVGVVYNGEDPADFPLVTEPEDYFCFLGRFDRDKAPHMAIQLAINLDMPIKLGGKIDHHGESYFREEIKPYLNHPLVDYLGELNFEDKVDLLSKARCNLHPTNFREPFGLTVIEAAYCGTPTLAVSRGSMPELIEQGRTGYLVEDFVEGRHHIDDIYGMDREYVASRARQLFNYRSMTAEYLEAYQRVLDDFKQRPDINNSAVKRYLARKLFGNYRLTRPNKIRH